MKTLYLEPFSGISGDMLIGALLDLGVDFASFKAALAKLELTGYELNMRSEKKSAINGTSFHVSLTDSAHSIDEGLTLAEQDGLATEPVHHHHHHSHAEDEVHEHHHHGRNLAEIQAIINASDLSEKVKAGALATFEEIARAEAKVHGLPLEAVHFHEVGAIDSIVDIVGAFIALDLLGVDQVISGELVDGTGTIKVAHGVMPVPVPAVMMMRQGTDIPIRQRTDVQTELITPTGLALVKVLVTQFTSMPSQQVLVNTGYGFGSRDTGSLNALRVHLFDSKQSEREVKQQDETVLELHTNLDDTTGEQLAFVMNELMEAGVYDVFFTPIFMKKGRPAYELTVILSEQFRARVTELLFEHTTTIGLRWSVMQRTIMQRSFNTVITSYGKLKVKVLTYNAIKKYSFEADELSALARKAGKSIIEIEAAGRLALENPKEEV
ncbi:hypothetical protein WOSG25_180060 [Weissella oryzae SG25]|uniref:Pyridinium-3,5-bisthiocarboxylic acid mononucleotide nickel insertion protein n=1 Tax=Weissella oryzae (strain DSM 25784 / JCM 18191 / LMG 30913 / SG25) TaxID=1329250 RepID=A0A069CWW4_WEIOS|nr:nickel pincer cofactor biosynthesis protein LarC [Weissella oryzae]GAK31857.1 hypothetical protein WOSG25_180060 [Weissella oryzae SG25]